VGAESLILKLRLLREKANRELFEEELPIEKEEKNEKKKKKKRDIEKSNLVFIEDMPNMQQLF